MTHRAVDLYEGACATEDVSEVDRLVRAAFTEDAVFESANVPEPIVGHQALADRIRQTRKRLAAFIPHRRPPSSA